MSKGVMVRLVIDREDFKDIVFGSGLTWAKKGDVKQVSEDVWFKMRHSKDVYERADGVPDERVPQFVQAAEKPAIEFGDDGMPIVPFDEETGQRAWTAHMLNIVEDGPIRAEAARRGFKIDKRYTGDRLRSAFLQSQKGV